MRDLAISLTEGRVNNLFSSICEKLSLHPCPEQPSSNVNHYLNLFLCRPWQRQCFPFQPRPQSKRCFRYCQATSANRFSPTAVLLARRKVICPACTTDESKPVMIEEGREWEAHARSKVHRHLAVKGVGNRHVSAKGSGNGKSPTPGTDESMLASLCSLFGP